MPFFRSGSKIFRSWFASAMRRPKLKTQSRTRLQVEQMEDRLVPNAAIVSYTNVTTVTGVTTSSTWMAQLPDSIPLTDVSLPGTSASASGPSLANAFLGDGSSAAAAADLSYASLATAAASVIAAQVQSKLSAAANASATTADTTAAAAEGDAAADDAKADAADGAAETTDGAAGTADVVAGTANGAAGAADGAAGVADTAAEVEAGADSVADGAAGTADGLAAVADDAAAVADTAGDDAKGTAIVDDAAAESVNTAAAATAEIGATADTAAATTDTATAATNVTTFGSNTAASLANGLSAASNATGAVADEIYVADTAKNNSTGNNPNNNAMQGTLVGLAQAATEAQLAAAPADTATALAYQAAATADAAATTADTTAAAADTTAATADTTAAAADLAEDVKDTTAASADAADITADTEAVVADEAAKTADTAAAAADATEVADTAAAVSADAAAATADAAATAADAAATAADATAVALDATAAAADGVATTADGIAAGLDIAAAAELGLDPVADALAVAADATAAGLDAAAGTADAAAVAADATAGTADAAATAATTAAGTADGLAASADAAEVAADGVAGTADGLAAETDAVAVTEDAKAVAEDSVTTAADVVAAAADTTAVTDNAAAAAADATAITDNSIAAAANTAATTADAAATAAAAISGPLDKLATGTGIAFAVAEKSTEAVEFSVQTQDLSIADQLNDGVRSLDLSGSLVNDTININTSQYYTGLTLQDVLNDSTAYLQAHPSETIVLSLSSNDNPQGAELNSVNSFGTDLNTLLNTADSSVPGDTYSDFIYESSSPTATPELGQVRGKIVIVPQAWSPTANPTTGLTIGWQPTEAVSNAAGLVPTDLGTPRTLYINNLAPDSTLSSLGSSTVNSLAESYFAVFNVNRTTGIVGMEEPDQTIINEIIDENNVPIIVSSDSDATSASGTLRDAINFANTHPGVNTIEFAGNLTGSTGQAILLQSNLPTITSDLDIVGSIYIDANGHTALQNSPTESVVEFDENSISTTDTVPVYFNTSGLTIFDHVAFITAAQTLTAGVNSATVTLQLQAANNNPVIVATGAPPLPVTLMTNSTSANAKFLNFAGGKITSVDFTAGSSITSFLYYDEKRAFPTLTATVATVSVTQTETVNANVPNPASLVLRTQPSSVYANVPILPVLQPVLDVYGNEVPNWTVTLTLNAVSVAAKPPSKPLLSVTTGVTDTNGLVTYPKSSVNLPGTYTLTVSIEVNGKVYSIISKPFKISANPLTVTKKVR